MIPVHNEKWPKIWKTRASDIDKGISRIAAEAAPEERPVLIS
jgi:hypothetical protein